MPRFITHGHLLLSVGLQLDHKLCDTTDALNDLMYQMHNFEKRPVGGENKRKIGD